MNNVKIEWDEDGNLLNNPKTLHNWKPIGNISNRFDGDFDGNNKYISGVYINQKGEGRLGLFGSLNPFNSGLLTVTVVNF